MTRVLLYLMLFLTLILCPLLFWKIMLPLSPSVKSIMLTAVPLPLLLICLLLPCSVMPGVPPTVDLLPLPPCVTSLSFLHEVYDFLSFMKFMILKKMLLLWFNRLLRPLTRLDLIL